MKTLIESVRQSVAEIWIRTQKGWEKNGSGFAISTDGLIATCHHVIKGYPKYEVNFGDGDRHEAKLERALPDCDVAVMRVQAKTRPLRLGKLSQTEVGKEVLWCGFPIDSFLLSFHKGMISYVGQIPAPGAGAPQGLQLDGTMNRGNSGGPIVDPENGRVVGILTTSLGSLHESLREQIKGAEASEDMWGAIVDNGKIFSPVRMLVEIVRDMERLIQLGVCYGISVDYLGTNAP